MGITLFIGSLVAYLRTKKRSIPRAWPRGMEQKSDLRLAGAGLTVHADRRPACVWRTAIRSGSGAHGVVYANAVAGAAADVAALAALVNASAEVRGGRVFGEQRHDQGRGPSDGSHSA